MKATLFIALVLSSAAHADEIKCPERFPAKDVALHTTPSDEAGTSRVRPAHLSGSYFEMGPLYVDPMVSAGPEVKVKGGWDIEYRLGPADNPDTRWLVCRYGGHEWGEGWIERWEKLPKRYTRCLEKVRGTRLPGTTSTTWTQTAVCT